MMVRSLRSGSPGVRVGLALLASLALHCVAFFPYGITRARPPVPLLTAILLPLPAASQISEAPESIPEQESNYATSHEPVAVPPAPTFPQKFAPPRPLTGQMLKSALSKMAHEEFYPREAIALGLEGRVVLLLVLADGGTVVSVEVARSSGHVILDEAAIKAAGRIDSVPGGRRQVLLPVEFRLD